MLTVTFIPLLYIQYNFLRYKSIISLKILPTLNENITYFLTFSDSQSEAMIHTLWTFLTDYIKQKSKGCNKKLIHM